MMPAPRLKQREYSAAVAKNLELQGVHPVLARIFAARGILSSAQLNCKLDALLSFADLRNCAEMAMILADAIAAKKHLLIIADYDADGATACAVAMRALKNFGATVDYLVPNRFEYGYGLSPEIVALAATRQPHYIITVDNGIASVEGVAAAAANGIEVLITDHHLPGDVLPQARCIVNPNQQDCAFSSKHLAGVGVIFYVMLALRAELRRRGAYVNLPEPNLAKLLDIVALGTVADVVKLDDNNRLLVHQGIRRIRAGKCVAGISALLHAAGRKRSAATEYDLGFVIGPRLNAAGRLDDMSLGIECLITDDEQRASALAQQLDSLNRQRREVERDMQDRAFAILDNVIPEENYSLCLYEPSWHQGVIGILASRLKDKFNRPAIVFARSQDGEIKGSGRSIRGLHLRDALDLIAKRHGGLILKFGGHAMAAGLTIAEHSLEKFKQAWEEVVRDLLSPSDLQFLVELDGSLNDEDLTLQLAENLSANVWGQGFPSPVFVDEFEVVSQRVVGEQHLKLQVKKFGRLYEAIVFSKPDFMAERVNLIYRLGINDYNDNRGLQLTVEHWQSAQSAAS